jgi:hypothetical protein
VDVDELRFASIGAAAQAIAARFRRPRWSRRLCARSSGICSLRNEEEGTFVNLEVPGVVVETCVDNDDCPAGKTRLFSCGQVAQESSYLGYCHETTICSM